MPLHLQWLAALDEPASSFDTPEGLERTLTLLRLHGAAHASRIADDIVDGLAPTTKQRAAAFAIARDLPCFDRDLTSFYTGGMIAAANTPPLREYELRVAHSIMRLSSRDTTYDHFVSTLLPNWRDHSCLLHVLAVLAANMPSLTLDWSLPDSEATPELESLVKTLPLARSYDAAARSIAAALKRPAAIPPAFAYTLDMAAIIMRVKSNPEPYPSDQTYDRTHSLDTALRRFTQRVRPDTCRIDADTLPGLWAGIKTELEHALPPSALASSSTSASHGSAHAYEESSSW